MSINRQSNVNEIEISPLEEVRIDIPSQNVLGEEKTDSSLNRLPDVLQFEIIDYLKVNDRALLASTCRLWKSLTPMQLNTIPEVNQFTVFDYLNLAEAFQVAQTSLRFQGKINSYLGNNKVGVLEACAEEYHAFLITNLVSSINKEIDDEISTHNNKENHSGIKKRTKLSILAGMVFCIPGVTLLASGLRDFINKNAVENQLQPIADAISNKVSLCSIAPVWTTKEDYTIWISRFFAGFCIKQPDLKDVQNACDFINSQGCDVATQCMTYFSQCDTLKEAKSDDTIMWWMMGGVMGITAAALLAKIFSLCLECHSYGYEYKSDVLKKVAKKALTQKLFIDVCAILSNETVNKHTRLSNALELLHDRLQILTDNKNQFIKTVSQPVEPAIQSVKKISLQRFFSKRKPRTTLQQKTVSNLKRGPV